MMTGWQPQTTRMRSVAPIAPTMRMPARSVPASAFPTAAALVDAPKCLNCDEILAGKFCHACGQSGKTPARFSVGAVLHELPHAILHLEHALPHTVFALLRRPGHTIREYLQGKRVKMYSPFTLLFMVSGLLVVALVALKLNKSISHVQVHATTSELSKKTSEAAFKYQAWIKLAMVPFIAMGPALVLRARTGLRYGEHLVVAAMATAGSATLTLLLLPLRWLAVRYLPAGAAASVASCGELLTTLYVIWAYAQLQDDGKRKDAVARWLRSIGSLLLTCVLGVVAAIAMVLVGVVVVVIGAGIGKALHLI